MSFVAVATITPQTMRASISATLREVSAHGLSVELSEEDLVFLSDGARVTVAFSGFGERLELPGQVAWQLRHHRAAARLGVKLLVDAAPGRMRLAFAKTLLKLARSGRRLGTGSDL